MDCVFVNDTKVYYYEGEYFHQTLSSEFWEKRYLGVFDKITVLCRQIKMPEESIGKIAIAENEFVKFAPIKEYKLPSDYFIHKKKIIKKIEKQIFNADCVIIRLPSFLGYIAIDVCKKLKKNYLIELVACPWDILRNYSKVGKVLSFYSRYAAKQRIHSAPYVLYVTQLFLQKRYTTNGNAIGCSDVVLPQIKDAVLEKRKQKITNNSNKIVIGTIGAVDISYKGQKYVIHALANLKRQGIEYFEYELVGGGNQDYLKQLAKNLGVSDKVRFLGTIQHSKMFEWLDGIDIYIQPSMVEGLPRALVEALSRGVPALATNVGGIPELLDSKYLFEKSTKCEKMIAKMLMECNEDRLLSMAVENFYKAEEYDANKLELKRINFYQKFAYESLNGKE